MNQIFPYEVRPQQSALLDFLEENMKPNEHVVFEASNGVGKTIVALSAAIAYRQSLSFSVEDYKILVLSRTNSQADRVIDELLKMKGKYSAISKRGKESMCNNPEINVPSSIPFQVRCERAVKTKKCTYYTRIKKPSKSLGIDQIRNNLLNLPMYSSDVIFEANQIGVCAAELSNSLVSKTEIISGSYLYLFDPEIQHGFLKMLGVDLNKIILVIDECHNLPNIVLDACEHTISDYQISKAKKELKGNDLIFLETLELLIKQQHLNKIISPIDFLDTLEKKYDPIHLDAHQDKDHVYNIIKHWIDAVKKHKTRTKTTFAYTEQVIIFLSNLYKDGDKSYRVLLRENIGKQTIFKFSLLDPSKNISSVLKKVHCSISMSGSLSITSFTTLTGIKFLDHCTLSLPSPYDRENVRILVTRNLSSKYNQRISSTFKMMGELISTLGKQSRNIGLFVPSYSILTQIKSYISGINTIYEARGDMSSEETDDMIEKFKKKKNALLISVMGGRSSEGTDFKGDTMEIVAIGGIPFGMPDTLTEARIKYFDKISNNGWQLIYLSRAIQQLSQAAGRPLRSLDDRVFILIMDERILRYEKQLPSWMQCLEVVDPKIDLIEEKLKEFYTV